jgi:hypothetical protein
MTKRIFSLCLWLSILLLTSCATQTKNLALDETLMQYAKYIRWNQFESALGLHHPKYLFEHPVSNLDIERLKLFKVTGYAASERNVSGEGNIVEQRVVIRMYRAAQGREISIAHDQMWQYDPELERWLLHSGLPDVTSRR